MNSWGYLPSYIALVPKEITPTARWGMELCQKAKNTSLCKGRERKQPALLQPDRPSQETEDRGLRRNHESPETVSVIPSTEGNWGRNKALSGEEVQAHCCERYFSWVVKGMRGRWFGQPTWLWPSQEICLCQEGAAVSCRGCHHGLGPRTWHLQQVGRSFRMKLKNIHHSHG